MSTMHNQYFAVVYIIHTVTGVIRTQAPIGVVWTRYYRLNKRCPLQVMFNSQYLVVRLLMNTDMQNHSCTICHTSA